MTLIMTELIPINTIILDFRHSGLFALIVVILQDALVIGLFITVLKLFNAVSSIIDKARLFLRSKYYNFMAATRATTKFNLYNYAALATFAQFVHDSLVLNIGTFATPSVSMATFQTNITALVTAIANWGVVGSRGSHADLIALRAAKQVVILNMRSLQAYVNTIANGVAATVTLSGFTGTNPHSVIGVLSAPVNVRQLISRKTLPAQAILKWEKPLNIGFGKANCYVVECDEGGTWKQRAITSRTKATIEFQQGNSNPTQTRVYAVNNAGNGAPSTPINVTFMF